jgi:cytochrome oxidase Cu insertion factor (SCO1/SenC/PrrC family)
MLRRTAVLLLWVLALAALPMGNQSWAQEEKKEAPPAAPEPKFKVGDMAPNFKLLDQNRKEVELNSFRGKKSVALAFYVFAFTGG